MTASTAEITQKVGVAPAALSSGWKPTHVKALALMYVALACK